MCKKTFVIAEAGVNHNGDFKIAKQLIDVAASSGADAVKFQTWVTDLLVTRDAQQAKYQKRNTRREESQYQLLKHLELSYSEFSKLKAYCDEVGILFLSTPDEKQSAQFLDGLQPVFKIGSAELTNTPFLRFIASLGKPVILSTGMSYLYEVEHALNIITDEGISLSDITLLHTTTDYPTIPEEVNLNAMNTIKNAFPGISVGYSDHTLGIEIPIAAVALGARVIEKHFTLDKTMHGPDHKASIEPEELARMVRLIRNVEKAMGNGWKRPTMMEIENRNVVRKSILAASDIKVGDKLTEGKLVVKRPGTGLSPIHWDEIINTRSMFSYKKGEMLK